MNTTLLFAEIFIIGLQTNFWILLLIMVSFGGNWMQALIALGFADGQTVMVVSSFSIMYVIGIIMDRVADLFFSPWDKKIRNQIIPKPPMPFNVMKSHLNKENESIHHQLEYTRSRIRISRASSINFSLITATGVYYISQLFPVGSPSATRGIYLGVICGTVVTFGALFAYERLTRAFYVLMESNWNFPLKPWGLAKNSKRRVRHGKQKKSSRRKPA